MAAIDFHTPPLGPPGEPCRACAIPLAHDQRYCLACGERRGPARLDPIAMARGAWVLPAAPAATAPATAPRAARRSLWVMPAPRVAATAALATLAFGIVAGTLAGPRADATLASAAGPVVLLAPPPAPRPAADPVAKPSGAAAPDTSSAPDTTSAPDTSAPADAPVDAAPADNGSTPAADTPATDTPATDPGAPYVPPVKHVWVVALTGHSFDEVDANPALMPYLSGTLAPKGLKVPKWEASSVGSLANLVVLVSGQRPTDEQQQGCATYADTTCVLPKSVDTLPSQLTAAGKTWHAYVEGSDVGSDPPDTCRHPQLGQRDPWTAPRPSDAYLTQRNPFVYFHSIVDTPDCGANLAGISRLAPDAADSESAPNVSFVIPDACHDGRDAACADGAPAGLGAADAWLKDQVGPLLASNAYADDGLIVVTFDHGPDPLRPIGALLLSAHVEPGTTNATPYTHTGLLKTLEDAFALERLGKAASPTVKTLGQDVFSVTTPSR